MGIKKLHIEGDSKLMVDSVIFGILFGWSTKDIFLHMNHLVSNLDMNIVTHIYREGNHLVDSLANLGSRWRDSKCWRNMGNLPLEIKGIILKDQGTFFYHDDT